MTAKKDLKARVRDRAARTGESYVTARRHVMARAKEAAAPEAPPPTAPPAMQIVELLDLSADAKQLGLRCRVMLSPGLAALAEPAVVLASLRDALVGTAGDPGTAMLYDLAVAGRAPPKTPRPRSFERLRQFFRRARAGIGGVTDDGTMLALPVAGRAGMVPVLCTIWHGQPALVLTSFDAEMFGNELWDRRFARELELSRVEPVKPLLPVAVAPPLFLVFDGHRIEIAVLPFVIGRNRSSDLRIKDGRVSREHASVIRSDGAFFITDTGSENGIVYRGMRIDNKRIDEGDVFELAGYELRFTYLATD